MAGRTVIAGSAVALAAVAACSVSVRVGSGRSDNATPASIVHRGRIALDFRQTPTRAALGLPAKTNWRSYEAADGHTYQLVIRLPNGVLQLPAHSVDGDTDDAGGANDTDYRHRPEFFTVDALYPSDAAADAALTQQETMLGIAPHATASTTVVNGSPSHRLSVTVQRRSNLVASVQPGERYYYFAFDRYRNPAVDAVLHGGRMTLDVRHRPSRAALGFVDDYAQATIQSVPASTAPVALTLRTPRGALTLAVGSVTSTSGRDADPQRTRERSRPTRTVTEWTSSVAEVRAQLQRVAPIFGLAPSALAGLLTGPAGTQRHLAAHTSAYYLQVEVEADPSRTDAFAASVSYRFTYR